MTVAHTKRPAVEQAARGSWLKKLLGLGSADSNGAR